MSYNSRSRRPAQRRQHSYTVKRKFSKENIHPSRFVKAAKPASSAIDAPQYAFADFDIHELLQTNLQAKGFSTPSPIQDQAIPVGLTGQDIIGIANTGTGKTIAFAVPLLQQLLAHKSSRALIMAPTRELATQIEGECKSLAKGSGLYGALLIGGSAMSPQLKDLRHSPPIVIGTPGRIKDHLERGSLDLTGFDIVVLDEVDRMLDMGFVNDMRLILKKLATPRQSFFFSATLDSRVQQLIQEFSHQPIIVSVKTGDTIDTVEQDVVVYASNGEKIDKLHDVLIHKASKALVFNDTQRSVERLSRELQARGFQADSIHGGKSQNQRRRALDRFKANEINILVATDVAARGIDVIDITHVINYSTPQSYNDYVHRIGRTGRAGRAGFALTFVES